MRLIDADALRKCVMKWLPKDPCGIEEKEFPFETDICVSMLMEIDEQPTIEPQKWIPCSERLPCDGIPVNITWVNRKPVSYYVDIKDKHFTSTGIYYRGKWFWYSWACEDLLYEYGNSKADAVDEDVEIVAWMPLPEPWKGENNDKSRYL